MQSCSGYVIAGQMDSGFGYQGGQFGDKVHRFEDDVSRAITIRGLQLIANHALFRQRQTLFSDGRSGDVAAQGLYPAIADAFEKAVEFPRSDRHFSG